MILAYTGGVNAQCNPFYLLQENGNWEMTIYDKNGKIDGRQTNEVAQWDDNSDGWKAIVKSAYYSKKDKLEHEGEFEITCDDGKIEFDLERYIPKESMESFRNMNMEVTGDNLILPARLEVGQSLPDGSIKFTGDTPMVMSVNIVDRKVVGKETITVPAGTFDCYKVTYTMQVKTIFTMETSGVEYVAEKVGVVKQESFTKNGKLVGYSELSSYSF